MKAMLTALALALTLPGGVWALPADPAAAQASTHFRRGTDLYRQARYREAIAEFEAAQRALPHPVLHYNLAQCHEKLGNIPAALKSYREYLRQAPQAPDRAEVITAIANLEQRLAAANRQELLVSSDPPGAEVWIDGQSRGPTPFRALLPFGAHQVSLVKFGYQTVTREAALTPERALQLDLTLQELAVPAVAEASGAPPAAGQTPAPIAQPDLTPAPLSELTRPLPAPAAPHRSRLWTWVALGTAAAAAGAGTYYGLSSRSAGRTLYDGSPQSAAGAQRLFDQAHSDARNANFLFGVAAVAGVTAVTLFFVEGGSDGGEPATATAR